LRYQLCRWYDLYPRLSFALTLLQLAPVSMQTEAIDSLKHLLGKTVIQGTLFTEDFVRDAVEVPEHAPLLRNRWYDNNKGAASAMELLKSSPEFVKNQVADLLLVLLASKADSPTQQTSLIQNVSSKTDINE
jgi:hypothetical protein